MSTLIAVYNSDGCVGRCDAKCYQATAGTPCDCICQGKNHAAGRERAVAQTAELAQQWVHAAELRHGGKLFGGLADELSQVPLL